MVFYSSHESRQGRGTTQRIGADADHFFDVGMIVDGDVSRAHRTQHETGGWCFAAGVGLGGNHGLCECYGTVQGSLARKPVAPGTGWQMGGKRVFDDLQEGCRIVPRLDFHFVQELHHQSREPFVGPGGSDLGVDLDQNFFRGGNVNSQQPRLVQGAVKESQDFLVQDVRTEGVGVFAELLFAQIAMVVAVEQFEKPATVLHGLQRSLIQQNNNRLLFPSLLGRGSCELQRNIREVASGLRSRLGLFAGLGLVLASR